MDARLAYIITESQTTYCCPSCRQHMILVHQSFHFAGAYWPGLACLTCNSLWEYPANHWGMTPLNEDLVEQSKTQPK